MGGVAATVAVLLGAAMLAAASAGLAIHIVGCRPRRPRTNRWAGYPTTSALIVGAVHVVPIAAAVATSALLSRRIHEPDGAIETALRWGALIATSTLVLLAVDRTARRALPLAALLKLSMVFPDAAPRRLAVARKSGSVRHLERRLAEARALGSVDEPARAAEVILSLVGALHGHDRHTRGHSERVRWFADLIAEELRLPAADRDRLRWAALLHDIGKLHVRRRILNKPSKLTAHEWKHIHRHPEEGAKITAPLAGWLGEWSLTIVQHHERYDGTGYPVGLRGDEISLGARIVAVADAFEVMTAVRAYKKAVSPVDARRELTRCAGTHFDPAVVRAFLQVSVGRLRWISGPAAWVAQLPFVGWLPRLADGAAALTGQAAGVAGAAAGAAALSTAASAVVPSDGDGTTADATNTPVLLEIPVASTTIPVVNLAPIRAKTAHTVPATEPGSVEGNVGATTSQTESTLPNGKEQPAHAGGGGSDGKADPQDPDPTPAIAIETEARDGPALPGREPPGRATSTGPGGEGLVDSEKTLRK